MWRAVEAEWSASFPVRSALASSLLHAQCQMNFCVLNAASQAPESKNRWQIPERPELYTPARVPSLLRSALAVDECELESKRISKMDVFSGVAGAKGNTVQ
ncbi:hypothetical protein [Caballeronia sp. LZ043]|uniref:hypothetical protein n=1 Tax=Caballeronia sp. LZ043 TaxID=3038569 RepID=UPI002856F541|nr:hypothetical protein [Caballeronia sp. LZ043]MDR5823749.1 hypothetical protein [Caballeronia sp. LZ043]